MRSTRKQQIVRGEFCRTCPDHEWCEQFWGACYAESNFAKRERRERLERVAAERADLAKGSLYFPAFCTTAWTLL